MSSVRLANLLIVDDESELTNALCEALTGKGYQVLGLASGEGALEALRKQSFDLLLTDLMMPGMDGITLLRSALEIDPHLVGVIMTGQATVQTAVEAMKVGAFDYVLKPFKLTALLPVLDRAMDVRRLRLENVQLRETVAIYELSTAIAHTLDPDTLVNKTVAAALQQMDADEASVMLPSSDGEALYVAAVRGDHCESLMGERVPLEQSIAGWVAQNREMLMLDGKMSDPRVVPLHPRDDVVASLSMPLLAGNRLVGVLNVNLTDRRRRFTLGQAKGLSILAGIAASALESALLYAQMREAETKYHSIFDNAVEGIFQSTLDGRLTAVNPALACMLGYASPGELLESPVRTFDQLFTDPRNCAQLRGRLDQVGEVRGYECQMCRKDGRSIWVSLSIRSVGDTRGTTLHYEGATEDISERREAEEATREQMEELRRWQSVTLGREDRIGELKHEVNELLAAMGQPARYSGEDSGAPGFRS